MAACCSLGLQLTEARYEAACCSRAATCRRCGRPARRAEDASCAGKQLQEEEARMELDEKRRIGRATEEEGRRSEEDESERTREGVRQRMGNRERNRSGTREDPEE
eukprot:6176575-Pleurochrysis_carterae.AAC.3